MPDQNLPTGLIGGPEKRTIVIVDYDPQWPAKYQEHARRILQAVGSSALQIGASHWAGVRASVHEIIQAIDV